MDTADLDLIHKDLATQMATLKALRKEANEAETRLKSIDVMLFDVLGWDKDDVDVETYCRIEGFADYVCKIEGRNVLVLEAKRAGKYFAIDGAKYSDRPYTFAFISSESKAAADALQQAIGYASTLGAHYVGITNGHQWLLTITYVEGQDLQSRKVYLFESLDAIQSRIRTFAGCFEKKRLGSHEVDPQLLEHLKKPAPAKVTSKIPGYPQSAIRNVIKNELSYVLNYVWQVMARDETSAEFMENCYVNPSSHDRTITLVRELLARRRKEDTHIGGEEVQSIEQLTEQIAKLPAERPIVILGEIGRGKTSFLRYLRYVAAKDVLNNFIQIDINFLDLPDTADQIPDYIYDQVEEQLNELYDIDVLEDRFVRGVLHSELMRLRKSPRAKAYGLDSEKYIDFELSKIEEFTGKRHSYLAKVLHHLKLGRRHSVAIFLDNLDRRSMEIQEQAFLKASAIARDWASAVFISLRPDTFYHSRETGVLDTIAPTVFTVSHPDLALVLKRRFTYAREIALGNRHNLQNVPGYDASISMRLPSVAQLLASLEFSARKRNGIIPVLEAVSNGNIRRMLTFTKSVLCSGHLDTRKILEIIQNDGRYTVPSFEAIKSLLYGDYLHYSAEASPFLNLFDIEMSDPQEHFLSLAVLHYLDRFAPDGPSKGYALDSELRAHLYSQAYSSRSVKHKFERLLKKQLIKQSFSTSNQTLKYCITNLGRFHLHHLSSTFQYIDAVSIDTPVLTSAMRKKVVDADDIHARIKRTRNFLSYITESANHVLDITLRDFWAEQRKTLLESISEIEDRVGAKPKPKRWRRK